ncbi:MAG: DEAD/DEAH box helicase [Gammaproteobacteria bacterium]|nr:DEAD/DEAH box helicase [Gammaproteobacteria bacterium]
MALDTFHPAVRAWFKAHFSEPTPVQDESWPAIARGEHTLLAAPTGSGKTLAAFMASIDALVKEGLERGLPDETRVLYISPLKALSNDIQKNLQLPLVGIRDCLLEHGLPDVDVRAWVRTGDTPQWERQKAARTPPHILVTTPESAYILLTSASGRNMLRSVRTVIVDEIHAMAGNKRGAHLSLSLERLDALTPHKLTRVGCSATQKPIHTMASFLLGDREGSCNIVDTGHVRERDMALEVPASPLEAVMANEVWEEIYDRLAELVNEHKTTLVFVNTRRLAERAAKNLGERIGDENVTSHHGSLAKEHRLHAEQRLKAGKLKCLIATASLELGIDIGDVNLVCQLGTPRSIAAFLQRVGRSGHSVGATPKGRLFPLSRDDLAECTALLHAANHGELDRIHVPAQPLDVLSQQIVAEVAGEDEWDEEALYQAFRRAWPFRELQRETFNNVVRMLSQGFSTRRGRRGAYLHHDAVNKRLRARRGARLTAITNGGAIPDQFDYDVILSPEGIKVGTLNEDFSFESMPGDIFQLGNTSYRILKVEQGKVHVEDARGEPPNLPFWLGEAPGRTAELSVAVSRLREGLDRQLDRGMDTTLNWLVQEYAIPVAAAEQLVHYMAGAKAALGLIPTQRRVVFERFFDETGDLHFVIHSPYGSRVNRAWGLSLRKRFCRKFNFELQAAALEDSIILSLGATHSFPVEEPAKYLNSATVRDILVQALLDAPMFPTHWRWVASIALAIKRNHNGKRAPAYFQRNDSEDLIAVVFPDQLACAENITGKREIPDHPLVRQAIDDCLHDVMDIDGFIDMLKKLEAGDIEIVGRDLNSPSPLAQEILTARPYAFLDDAPAEERRALAVQSRRYLDPVEAADLGRLDAAAVKRVRDEAWPDPRTPDELHDALVVLGFITDEEGQRSNSEIVDAKFEFGWRHLFDQLVKDRRATVLDNGRTKLWIAAERLAEFQLVYDELNIEPNIEAVAAGMEPVLTREEAIRELLRSRLEGLGPTTSLHIASHLNVDVADVELALLALEQEGFVMRGRFTADAMSATSAEEWCERRLLARIHRYTIKRLRSEIEPVSPADYMRFLLDWHGLTDRKEGSDALSAIVEQLEGFSAAAGSWERDIIPARLDMYTSDMLDTLCAIGKSVWLRLNVRAANGEKRTSPIRNAPVTLLDRQAVPYWRDVAPLPQIEEHNLTSGAQKVSGALRERGALFFLELVQLTGLLRTQVEDALGELVNWGLVTSDSFAGLRALVTPSSKRPGFSRRRGRVPAASGFDRAGRWALVNADADVDHNESLEHIAWVLLRRYGVVFRKVLERESNLPPWRELLRVYWRMEARGEIRGGRFVQMFAGEQFALPDAVAELRSMRKRTPNGDLVAISAADPLNLLGIVLPGEKVAAMMSNRILFRDGLPIAQQTGDDIRAIGDAELDIESRTLLLRKQKPASLMPTPRTRF